jgi:O-antigen ligase
MTAPAVERRRRRRSSSGFGPTGQARARLPIGWRFGLMVLPAVLAIAHLMFGANHPAAALWLTAVLSLALAVVLITPLRLGLHDLTPALPLGGLFLLVLAAALWSLTPWTPEGPHPLWVWAGVTPGAATIDRSATLVEIAKLLGLAAVFVIGALQGIRRDRARATLEAVVWTGGLYAAISLLTFLAGVQVAQLGGRLSGGFLSANSGATVFGVLTVLGLALFLKTWARTAGQGISRRLTDAAVPLASLLLCAVCLLLTASRMGLVATAFALAAFLLWELAGGGRGRVPVLVGVALLIGLGTLLTFGGNDLVWTRVGGIDGDVDVRAQIFAAHWAAFVDSPLFGYGLGSFDATNTQIMTAESFRNLWIIRATHNVYLQWLQEAGLVGAVPMFLLIGLVLLVSVLRASGGRDRTLQAGLICASLVVLVHGLTDYALQVPSIAAVWAFLLGLGLTWGQGRSG